MQGRRIHAIILFWVDFVTFHGGIRWLIPFPISKKPCLAPGRMLRYGLKRESVLYNRTKYGLEWQFRKVPRLVKSNRILK